MDDESWLFHPVPRVPTNEIHYASISRFPQRSLSLSAPQCVLASECLHNSTHVFRFRTAVCWKSPDLSSTQCLLPPLLLILFSNPTTTTTLWIPYRGFDTEPPSLVPLFTQIASRQSFWYTNLHKMGKSTPPKRLRYDDDHPLDPNGQSTTSYSSQQSSDMPSNTTLPSLDHNNTPVYNVCNLSLGACGTYWYMVKELSASTNKYAEFWGHYAPERYVASYVYGTCEPLFTFS
jgi:hypothetical protein